jgi:hypothetical protein
VNAVAIVRRNTMSETLRDRLDNLEMFLQEIAEGKHIVSEEVKGQAEYHAATMELLDAMLEGKE